MKKIGVALIVAVLIAAAIIIGITITENSREKQCREYEACLAGHTFSGYDSTTTANHGKVSYRYTLELKEDGTCLLHFKATRSGDTGSFPKNGTWSFDLTGMTWSVTQSRGDFALFLSGGDWNWQDWSAATINRNIRLIDIGELADDSLPLLKATRSGHYDFYFSKAD